MKSVAQAISEMSQHQIIELERDGILTLDIESQPITVEIGDVEIRNEDIPGWLVANEGSVTVALDVTITGELRREGIARELVNRIQNLRKSRDYDITQRINIAVAPSELINDAVNEYADYICKQVLADSLLIADVNNPLEDYSGMIINRQPISPLIVGRILVDGLLSKLKMPFLTIEVPDLK